MVSNRSPGSQLAKKPLKGAAGRILKAATELFHERGVRAVGVDEIVRRAGATKPSLYHRFASKDGLVAACLEQIAEEAKVELEARMSAAGEDPMAQLRALVGYCADRMAAPGFRGSPMSNTAVEFPDDDHPARAVAVENKIYLRERVQSQTRRLTVEDPEELADGIVLLIEGAFSTQDVFGPNGPANALVRLADRLVDAYLNVAKP